MTRNIVSVGRNTPLQEAAQLMKSHDIGSIPVVDGDRIAGIITDRDIVLRGIAENNEVSGMTCGDIMSADIVAGSPDMDVHEAAEIMAKKQIRRLPVVENGKLVGMVALGDLAVEPRFVNEAGDALNDISKPSQPMM
jgi:CBS domain-containing protein